MLNDCPNDDCRRAVLFTDVMMRRQQVATMLAIWLGLWIVFLIFASFKSRRLRRNTLHIPRADITLERNGRHITPADDEIADHSVENSNYLR